MLAHTTPQCTHLPRLAKALEEAKRRLARAQKSAHAAEVTAAELKGKGDAEREAARTEVCVWGGGVQGVETNKAGALGTD